MKNQIILTFFNGEQVSDPINLISIKLDKNLIVLDILNINTTFQNHSIRKGNVIQNKNNQKLKTFFSNCFIKAVR